MQTYAGYVTADATVKNFKVDNSVTNFTVAENRRFKVDGKTEQKAVYVDCSYWNSPTQAPYLKKGTLVLVSGHTDVRAWNDKDGKARANLILKVIELKFLVAAKKAEDIEGIEPESADDLPF
jgi:single-strand DNA-binding protein